MREIENILNILKQAKKAVNENNPIMLRNLSNQTVHTASLTQDPDNIAVAVVIYSLGKIFERADYRTLKGWGEFQKLTTDALTKSIEDLEKKNEERFRKDFEFLTKAINKISGKLRTYIEEVFKGARINKASRIYEHGISLEQTAKLLGISMYDLAEYAGKTGISEVEFAKTTEVKARIKWAKEMFE